LGRPSKGRCTKDNMKIVDTETIVEDKERIKKMKGDLS
jgi:hypothetical protein